MCKTYIIFGAGEKGKSFAGFAGIEKVSFFIDNDENKKALNGISVYSFHDGMQKKGQETIVVCAGDAFRKEMIHQLESCGIDEYILEEDERKKIIRQKVMTRQNCIMIYDRAIGWIYKNTNENEGIINTSKLRKSYPEVSGYYIPSLLQWGHRNLAIQYAKWLCRIQKEDGSWFDANDEKPYVFDTAQILKGLLSICYLLPEVSENIERGCNWLISNIQSDGRMKSPRENDFGDEKTFSELIHIYCLSPLVKASDLLKKPLYKNEAMRALAYYKKNMNEEINRFGLLSHFYAYVLEGLLDLGEIDIVESAMDKIADLQNEKGWVPAYSNVSWICSTGLFQFAVIWFRLGDVERGQRAFDYACRMQNTTGGWDGGYLSESDERQSITYFPNEEISWAVKYFLDALYWKNKSQFELQAPNFKDTIPINDGRFSLIKNVVDKYFENKHYLKVADIGCGKGAYIKNLKELFPGIDIAAIDISNRVLGYIPDDVWKVEGTLTCIPIEDKHFDISYTCEALEHAIDIKSSIREMARLTCSGGAVVVIDKNKDMLGALEIEEWEQWFDETQLKNVMLEVCDEVDVIKSIAYEKPADGLFYAWIGRVK